MAPFRRVAAGFHSPAAATRPPRIRAFRRETDFARRGFPASAALGREAGASACPYRATASWDRPRMGPNRPKPLDLSGSQPPPADRPDPLIDAPEDLDFRPREFRLPEDSSLAAPAG